MQKWYKSKGPSGMAALSSHENFNLGAGHYFMTLNSRTLKGSSIPISSTLIKFKPSMTMVLLDYALWILK